MNADKKRIENDLENLRELSKDPAGGVTRLAYSEEESKAHEYIAKEAEKTGLKTRRDSIGNLYARLGGSGRAIRIGSHLDSVNNGGNYDGAVGVVSSMEALRCLSGEKLKHPVELVVFRAEESARFSNGCLGSQMIAGKLGEKDTDKLKDREGVSLREAMRKCGYDAHSISQWNPSETVAFIEPHIEQARVLENEGIPIGIVTGIAGPVRYEVTVTGTYDHSGATPMNLRKDAVAAASEMIVAAEDIGKNAFADGKSTVVTVGDVSVPFGSINKVIGKCTFLLDIRDIEEKDRDDAEKKALSRFSDIAEARGVQVENRETQRAKPAIISDKVQEFIETACKELKTPYRKIISGAGQDSQHVANIGIPTGMIFVPSKAGISHAPEEFTKAEDIVKATNVLIECIKLFQNR
jgi:hydantoinase/carbamoylase family amidase